MNTPSRISRYVLILLAVFALLFIGGTAGWYFGMRDGVGLAYSEVALALRTYHLAAKNGDSKVQHNCIEHLTELTVCHLVDTDTSSHLTSRVPYKSYASISMLKQVWQPASNAVLVATPHYPHTPRDRDYKAALDRIPPSNVDLHYTPLYAE